MSFRDHIISICVDIKQMHLPNISEDCNFVVDVSLLNHASHKLIIFLK